MLNLESPTTEARPQGADLSALAGTLRDVAAAHGVEIEVGRARALLEQAAEAIPGSRGAELRWMKAALASLGLSSRIVEMSLAQAIGVGQEGAHLVAFSCAADHEAPTCQHVRRLEKNAATLAGGASAEGRRVGIRELRRQLGLNREEDVCPWLVVNHVHVSQAARGGRSGLPAPRRLLEILRPEWPDIWVVLVFAFFAGLLSLATPVAVEALVNTVAFGRLLQPIVVLAILLFVFLAFGGAMQALQTFVVELIQRRLFARVAADVAFRLPRVRRDAFQKGHGPELVNRFFDVVTLQKVSAQLLLDGVAIVLTSLVGMLVMALYHPWLLGFNLVLTLTVVFGVALLGRGALRSGIEESKYKYRVAAWLEEVARCNYTFKSSAAADFVADRTNSLTSGYLNARRHHFGILLRQIVFVLGLQAVAGTVLLGFGGWLVIQGQLTLGQLVAAELIVAAILGSLAKLGKHLEAYYDVCAAVDKLGQLFDLPLESRRGELHGAPHQPAGIPLEDITFRGARRGASRGLDLRIPGGKMTGIRGARHDEAAQLIDALYHLGIEDGDTARLGDTDLRSLQPDAWRDHVAVVARGEVFSGTIAENVSLHRPGITARRVRQALRAAGLLESLESLSEGIDTALTSRGYPLSREQRIRLLLARAVAGSPRLILIDHALGRSLPRCCGRVDGVVGVASQRDHLADCHRPRRHCCVV